MEIIKKFLTWVSHWDKDKILHFSFSMVIAMFTAILVRLLGGNVYDVIAFAWFVGFVAGIGKEFYDERKYGGADEKDWAADLLGTTIGVIFSYLLIII